MIQAYYISQDQFIFKKFIGTHNRDSGDDTLRSATHKPKCSKAQIDILLSRDKRLDASTDALMTMRALLN